LKSHRRRSLNLEVMLDVRIVDVRDLVRAGRDGRGHAHERERITGGRGHGDSRNGGDLSQHLPIIARRASSFRGAEDFSATRTWVGLGRKLNHPCEIRAGNRCVLL